MAIVVTEADDAELERRRARAAKFEVPVKEPAAPVAPAQMLTMEEIARREESAAELSRLRQSLDRLVTLPAKAPMIPPEFQAWLGGELQTEAKMQKTTMQ